MKAVLSNPKAVAGLAVAVAGLVLAGGWFLLVSPQRDEATELDQQIAAVEKDVAQRKAELANPKRQVRVRQSDLYRLRRAMPDSANMPGVMLELDRLAGKSKVSFESIAPQGEVQLNGFSVSPVELVLTGRFVNVSRFLRELRTLVAVENGKLDARGRIYSVDSVQFIESEDGFPDVEATLRVNAFKYGGGALPPGVQADEAAPNEETPGSPNTSVSAVGATP
jgi:Tfp pilus assembly protein PilO